MKRYALFLSLIAFGYILGWTSSVLRFGLSPFGSHRGPRDGRGPEHMFEGIGLKDDQMEAIRKIRSEEKTQRESLRTQMDEARRNFEQVLDSTQDLDVLQKAFDRMTASKNAMEQAHFNSMMRVHQVLTLDQIKQLGAKRPKGGPGMGMGGPGGPGGRPPHDHEGRRGPDEGPPPPRD